MTIKVRVLSNEELSREIIAIRGLLAKHENDTSYLHNSQLNRPVREIVIETLQESLPDMFPEQKQWEGKQWDAVNQYRNRTIYIEQKLTELRIELNQTIAQLKKDLGVVPPIAKEKNNQSQMIKTPWNPQHGI